VDLSGGPPGDSRERPRRAEPKQLLSPAAVEDGPDGVPAGSPEGLVVRGVIKGIDPGEAGVVTEQIGVQVDERYGREVGSQGLESVDGITGHGPRSVRELPMLRDEFDECPPDLQPPLFAEAVRVDGLELREQPVPVGARKAVDVVGEVVPATGVLSRVLDGARDDLRDPVEQLRVGDRLGLALSPRAPPWMVRRGAEPAEVGGKDGLHHRPRRARVLTAQHVKNHKAPIER